MDELKEINLETEKHPRLTFISALFSEGKVKEMKALFSEFTDCFAWSYDEMSGLSPNKAVHILAIKPDAIPIKQAPKHMRLEIEEHVIIETEKLIDADFIREEKYVD